MDCWPGIVSITASDAPPVAPGLSDGDVVNITFTKPTNKPGPLVNGRWALRLPLFHPRYAEHHSPPLPSPRNMLRSAHPLWFGPLRYGDVFPALKLRVVCCCTVSNLLIVLVILPRNPSSRLHPHHRTS